MGGQVRVVLVEKDKVQSFVAWTNSIARILKSQAFINGDLSEVYQSIDYFKSLQKDYEENKETKNFNDKSAPYYGLYDESITPVEYGMIYIDTVNKKILYSWEYSNLKTLNFGFGLYRNGVLLLTDTALDQVMKVKGLSHFEFYDEKEAGFKIVEINKDSSTIIDLINQIKENIDLETLDYTELGIGAHIRCSVYVKTPYEIKDYKQPKNMVKDLIKLGANLSIEEIESIKKFKW